MKFYLRRNAANQWRWRLRATNNRIIAESGEAYLNQADCLAAIALGKGSANTPTINE